MKESTVCLSLRDYHRLKNLEQSDAAILDQENQKLKSESAHLVKEIVEKEKLLKESLERNEQLSDENRDILEEMIEAKKLIFKNETLEIEAKEKARIRDRYLKELIVLRKNNEIQSELITDIKEMSWLKLFQWKRANN